MSNDRGGDLCEKNEQIKKKKRKSFFGRGRYRSADSDINLRLWVATSMTR
jgi:hypothetical protein